MVGSDTGRTQGTIGNRRIQGHGLPDTGNHKGLHGFHPQTNDESSQYGDGQTAMAQRVNGKETWIEAATEDHTGKGDQMTSTEVIARMSWNSAGVLMPEWAFRANVPRSQRQYLGRWASESTSDTYTREHRHVILDIW